MAEIKKTELEWIFGVPLMRHVWDDCDRLNEALRRAILTQETRAASDVRSNIGGWQSTPDIDRWIGRPSHDLVKRLIAMLNHATRELYAHAGADEGGNVRWQIGGWANVNRAGHYNQLHAHPDSTWSAVYYVDAGDAPPEDNPYAGCLTLHNPNLAMSNTFFIHVLPDRKFIQPETGLMVLFPSFLQHCVEPYCGDKPRISLAFNARKDPYP